MKIKLSRLLCALTAMLFVSLFSAVGVSAVQDGAQPDVSAVSQTDTLSAGIKLSARKIYEGDTVKVSVTAEGGSGKYTYKCTATNLVTGKTVFSESSDTPDFMVRFGRPESYLVTAAVYDENEQEITVEKNITVCKALPFVEKGTAVSASRVLPGGTITVTANATGGKKPYMYKYVLKDSETGKVISSKNEMSPTMQFTLPEGEPKFYKIITQITDMKNNIVSKTIEVSSYKENAASLAIKGSISEKYAAVGKELTVTAKADGGIAPYKYKAFYKSETGRWTECIASYQCSPVMKFEFPRTEGKYRVKVAAIDLNGRYAEKEFSVWVRKFTVGNSFLTTSKFFAGSSVGLVSAAQYANGSVKYRYSYREEGGNWNYAGSFSSVTNHNFIFNKAGKYEIRVNAKDSGGNSAEKVFSVNVLEMDVSGSSVDKTSATIGEAVTLSAAVKNNNGSAKYQYSYSTDGKNWKYMGDYTASSSYQFKFDTDGTYYIRVGVKDKNGEGVYKEKQFKINVYIPSTKTTTAAAFLQKDASWKSSTLCAVPSGSKVGFIKTEGRWCYVKYNGKFGYIYNKALGTVKNYSSITTQTLPAVADDILFTRGKNISNIFDYVYKIGYRASRKDTVENLCVYILTYRGGACFHHAGLLYYLLDRAGFEAMVVDGAVDNPIGDGTHNWCMVKTEKGWRHLDPTSSRTRPKLFLVTDEFIDRYYQWDMSKYPACK